jgi:hypothetical protein
MEVDMNVYLVEDLLADIEKIDEWIVLVNEQLGDSNSALSLWCKKQNFVINSFKFSCIKGTGKRTSRNQYYCEEDVSNILSELSKNNDDKLLLLDIKLKEYEKDGELADKILNELYRQPGTKVKVLIITSRQNFHDQLNKFTCDPIPAYTYKSMLFPAFFAPQFRRSFVFFSQKGRSPTLEETQGWSKSDTEGA